MRSVPLTKQLADLITLTRAFLAPWFVWLGFRQGSDALPQVVVLMILNWTGDSVDGALARRSGTRVQTWIGDHDLAIDMLVSAGLLGYMVASGFLAGLAAAAYVLVWLVILWRWEMARSLGMLFQAPIYGWFIWTAISQAPEAGRWLLVWIVAAIIVTWPKFPKQIVPGFLDGMREALEDRRKPR